MAGGTDTRGPTGGDRALARAFGLGEPSEAAPLVTGHIHETRILRCGGARYLLQRLNTKVFREPRVVMENVVRVTAHLRARVTGDPDRRVLRVLPATTGEPLAEDPEGAPWRCYLFVEGSRSVTRPEDAAQARRAARAFGEFAVGLVDLDPPPADTIPHFHDFPRRFAALERAAREDPVGRGAEVAADVEAAAALFREVQARHDCAGLPERVVHNDCKLNNLLFDAATGEALCVVDLDTVMVGSLVYDFGELVRTASCRAEEDEPVVARMQPVPEFLGALARGYWEGVAPIATSEEREALPLAGARLALENALRFLTDHLEGDVYFPAHRPHQNLERHRAQRRLAGALIAAAPALARALSG